MQSALQRILIKIHSLSVVFLVFSVLPRRCHGTGHFQVTNSKSKLHARENSIPLISSKCAHNVYAWVISVTNISLNIGALQTLLFLQWE